MADDDILNGRQAKDALGVSKKTLLRYLRAGVFPHAFRLPSTPTHPGEWRIPKRDIVAFKARG
jgi:predicted site-specific integrase-resolvase